MTLAIAAPRYCEMLPQQGYCSPQPINKITQKPLTKSFTTEILWNAYRHNPETN